MASSINNTFDKFRPVTTSQVEQDNSSMQNSRPLASVRLKDLKNTEKEESHKFTTGLMILGASAIGLFLARGVSSRLHIKVKQSLAILKEKILTKELKNKSKGILENCTTFVQKGIVKCFSFMDASSNINTLKDILFTKLMRSNKHTSKLTDTINNLFRKTAISSTDKAYKAFGGAHEDLISQATKLLGKNSPELKELKQIYDEGFSKTARDGRIGFIMDSVKNLYSDVSKKLYKNGVMDLFKNWKDYTTYITTDLVKKEKLQLQSNVMNLRRAYSNNAIHQTNDIKQALNQIRVDIPIGKMTAENLKTISQIEEYAIKYKSAQGSDKEKIIIAIESQIQNLKKAFSHSDVKSLSQNITQIEKSLNNEKGVLQKLVEQVEKKYANNPNSEELKEFKRLSNVISAKLDKAVNMEHTSLFDKLAEIEVGSAPTDVLSLAIPIGLAGYQISKSEGSDEKIGTTLKTGIPIVGAIGTALYGTVRMFSGIQNIILGLISGWGLSVAGNIANDKYIAKAHDREYINQQLMALGIDPKHPIITNKTT